jgi:hypothetical protein
MKAYITKYALTKGIQEVDDALAAWRTDMIHVKSLGEFAVFHGEGREWHRTRESAVKRALVMRDKKIASLRKAIGKLADLTFS